VDSWPTRPSSTINWPTALQSTTYGVASPTRTLDLSSQWYYSTIHPSLTVCCFAEYLTLAVLFLKRINDFHVHLIEYVARLLSAGGSCRISATLDEGPTARMSASLSPYGRRKGPASLIQVYTCIPFEIEFLLCELT